MKVEHRAKALECYEGARLVLSKGMVYPSYVLLKEATRALLAYIAEDNMGYNFTEKSKLKNLMELMTDSLVPSEYIEKLNIFIEMENSGLGSILALGTEPLLEVKSALKKLIGTYLSEHV